MSININTMKNIVVKNKKMSKYILRIRQALIKIPLKLRVNILKEENRNV